MPPDNTDRIIMDYLSMKSETVYNPEEHLSLDEGSMAWQGRLSFRVNQPHKPDKYSGKIYILVQTKTHYVFHFKVYCGIYKRTSDTVMDLISLLC